MKETIYWCLILFIGFLSGVSIASSYYTHIYKGCIPKSEVVDAFKDVDWRTQNFMIGSSYIESKDGQINFYKVKSIDEAMEKLNKRLSK